MIINKETLDLIQQERINNNIDIEDVIRFVSTYAMQEKVSEKEAFFIADFCGSLIHKKYLIK